MFCANCGSQIADGAVFCPNCGQATAQQAAAQQAAAPQQPVYEAPQQTYQAPQYQAPQQSYQAPQYGGAMPPVRPVTFGEAIKNFFTQYATFSGRATRAEYWYMFLLNFLVGMIPVVGYIWALGTFIPSLAIAWRRLHDVGKSGAYYFMNFIPLVGWIFYLVAVCKESEGDNQYGPRKI
ncbi:MAG: DUF805 domain-containing protein [Clostridia bacterium]|nr:DUF805 domain-containing protein [Clostridia bacterium]